MLEGYGPVTQALLGTLFTWGMTAAGAALVVVIRGTRRKVLDASLGFAAGVMIAASYWSLLAPAIQLSEESGLYGENGEYAFLPVTVGFLLGAIFVYGTDVFLDYLGISSANMMLAMTKANSTSKNKVDEDYIETIANDRRNSNNLLHPMTLVSMETGDENLDSFSDCISNQHSNHRGSSRRRTISANRHSEVVQTYEDPNLNAQRALEQRQSQWKRIMLLVVAITVHNIPEGLAVGVGFAAVGSSSTSTFQSARNLAIGIGIQNFPEGLAVSLPLQAAGFSVWRSLWYGQLSGMVEPVFGVLGAVAVGVAQPVLPYALSFAAGAMIYVVADDIIPEANTGGNSKLATWGCIFGFVVMMCLDVGLG